MQQHLLEDHITLDVGHRLSDVKMSNTHGFHHDFKTSTTFKSLKLVQIQVKIFDLLRLCQFVQCANQVFEKLLLLLQVLCFFFLDLDFNHCFEATHDLFS